MDDVLGYAGKRVIVTGAASGVGEATSKLLVELGAEVHAVDLRKPEISGLASFTEADPREPRQIDAAVDRIGAIVNALFECASVPDREHVAAAARHVTERVVPLMVEGSAVGSVVFGDEVTDEYDEYIASRAAPFAQHGVRINGVHVGSGAPPDAVAWLLLFLNSRRASSMTGAVFALAGGPTGS
jgi:NAD(P)-dependent dehydrogenase (short-subunit alcohol dehydrogenase family)